MKDSFTQYHIDVRVYNLCALHTANLIKVTNIQDFYDSPPGITCYTSVEKKNPYLVFTRSIRLNYVPCM